eukprot:scaffold65439_cov46-Attheya_sp.AAC.4
MTASARSSRSNPSSANVDDPKEKWTHPDNVVVRIQSDAAVMQNSESIPYCSCYSLSRKVLYPGQTIIPKHLIVVVSTHIDTYGSKVERPQEWWRM